MTETTQPDPQVVASIREWLNRHPDLDRDSPDTARRALNAYVATTGRLHTTELVGVYAAACRPLTTADVSAGQGPASLLITSSGGRPALWFKAADGTLHFIRWAAGPGDTPAARALWDHLTATIPHVTTEEES